MNDRQRLEAIINVIGQYLPPDGIPVNDAMSEIISLVDPLPPQRTAAEGEDTHRAWVNATTWRGLTDEDYQILREGVVKQGKPLHWMIEHIEAKLREKNSL
jgi:hypothetical protein